MTAGTVADAPSTEDQEVIDGRYEIVRELGRGAMGVVFHVRDRATDRELALKQLSVPQADPSRQARAIVRFRHEFHTIAGLCHPCVVGAYEYGIADDKPYYTMELLEGPTLRDMLGAPVGQCCRMLRGVASALAFLHSRRLLHRDLKARNVRCDAQGQPKLLDFGVLATMGVAGDVAGTPPGIPPEAVRGLPLDARSDLFGLGTLAYRLLTGHQAYPAESVAELEDHWRRRPERPAVLRPEVPEALDELVMALLSIEAVGRPSSAAEVIARLDTIGGLEQAPELEVAQGWLKSARLVGRTSEIHRIREAVDHATQGEGTMIVVEGPSGVGKTRLLREAGLHAQLAGATVLRGRGRGAGYSPYDLVRQLVREMVRLCPADARETGRDRVGVLGRVMPELRSEPPPDDESGLERHPEERHRIQQQLLEWFLAMARRRPLVLVIDDLERSDEGSAALLAALAHVARDHAIAILGARRTNVDGGLPRSALREVGEHVRLSELDRAAVAELVQEWFGDMPGSAELVAWIHRAAGGSPLHCTELARHLVEQGVVLYAEGMWRLMADPGEVELPQGMADTMDLRVEMLSPLGRALGQALALWHGAAPVELCAELFDPEALSAVFEALDELVYEEIIVGGDDGFDLSHDGVRDALLRSLEPQEREEIHRRTAELIIERWGPDGGERRADLGWHLLRGGRTREGAEQLEQAGRHHFGVDAFEDAIPLLEAALEVYRAPGGEPGDALRSLELQALLVRAGVVADRAVMVRHAQEAIDGYAHRGGLPLARRLAHRVGRRLALVVGLVVAYLRWWLGGRQGPSPRESLVVTVTLASHVAILHAICFDVGQIQGVRRSVELLRAIRSPVGRAASDMFDALLAFATGRWDQARDHLRRVLDAFERIDDGRVPEVDRRMILGGARAVLVVVQAVEQDPGFGESTQALRELGMRFFTLGAEMGRVFYHRLRGEETHARQVLHDTEVGVVQLGNAWTFEVVGAWVSAIAYGLTRDVLALRRVVDQLERLDRAGMRLSSFAVLARGELLRIQGDPDGARALLEAELRGLPSAQRLLRLVLRSSLVDARLDCGDAKTAVTLAEQALDEAPEGTGPHPARVRLRCSHALALARLDRLPQAHDEIDELVEDCAELDSPLLVGMVHEAGAMVAEAREQELARRQHATRAELLFASTGNPVLIARARRLVRRARHEAIELAPLPDSEISAVSEVLDTVDLDSGEMSLSLPERTDVRHDFTEP